MTDPQPVTDHASERAQPPAPWQEPALGGYPQPGHWRRDGLQQLRAMITGAVPAPPISRLTGMRIVSAHEGTATFEMPLTRWLCAPQGAISIGPLTMPADAAVACAIQTQLPPATPFTTSELSMRLLAPVGPKGKLTARGSLIQVRRTIALAEVRLSDDQDRLIAHGSSLCFLAPQVATTGSEPHDAPEPSTKPAAAGADPDPFERPTQGEVITATVWQKRTGLDILQAQLAGELPSPPIHFLTGLRLTAVSEAGVSFSLPATEWLCAPARGRIQGGAVALLAEAALDAAIQARLPPGTALAPVDLKVNYLRPLAADGRLATATGTVAHAGRRIAVARSTVTDADGRAVALATGSAMLIPGREASLGVGER